jgi:NAD(P)-dependent dehydrogenase (short-subunit alcohol dehydrogenase family)
VTPARSDRDPKSRRGGAHPASAAKSSGCDRTQSGGGHGRGTEHPSLKRFVDPDDIAALALFVASDSAKSISGQTIAIDGHSQAAQ